MYVQIAGIKVVSIVNSNLIIVDANHWLQFTISSNPSLVRHCQYLCRDNLLVLDRHGSIAL